MTWTKPTGAVRRYMPCWILLCGIVGCAPAESELGSMLRNFQPGPGWTSLDPREVVVPGDPVAAWSGPNASQLALFRALPIPRPDPRALLQDWVSRLTGMPETRILSQEVLTVGDRPAFRMDAVALGTGGTWAPIGLGVPPANPDGKLVPTRRVLIGIPEPTGTSYIQWTYPDSGETQLGPIVASQLQTLGVRSAVTGASDSPPRSSNQPAPSGADPRP